MKRTISLALMSLLLLLLSSQIVYADTYNIFLNKSDKKPAQPEEIPEPKIQPKPEASPEVKPNPQTQKPDKEDPSSVVIHNHNYINTREEEDGPPLEEETPSLEYEAATRAPITQGPWSFGLGMFLFAGDSRDTFDESGVGFQASLGYRFVDALELTLYGGARKVSFMQDAAYGGAEFIVLPVRIQKRDYHAVELGIIVGSNSIVAEHDFPGYGGGRFDLNFNPKFGMRLSMRIGSEMIMPGASVNVRF